MLALVRYSSLGPALKPPLSSSQLILIVSPIPPSNTTALGAVDSACEPGEKGDKPSPRHSGPTKAFLMVASAGVIRSAGIVYNVQLDGLT